MLLSKKMNPEELKNHLLPAKNWITTNQKTNGAILWDESGKWDAWDHSECLIALAIYEDWEAFELGIEFLIENPDVAKINYHRQKDFVLNQERFNNTIEI